MPRGEDCRHVKLREKDVLEIRKMLDAGIDRREISKRFDVTLGQIAHINTHHSWTHLE